MTNKQEILNIVNGDEYYPPTSYYNHRYRSVLIPIFPLWFDINKKIQTAFLTLLNRNLDSCKHEKDWLQTNHIYLSYDAPGTNIYNILTIIDVLIYNCSLDKKDKRLDVIEELAKSNDIHFLSLGFNKDFGEHIFVVSIGKYFKATKQGFKEAREYILNVLKKRDLEKRIESERMLTKKERELSSDKIRHDARLVYLLDLARHHNFMVLLGDNTHELISFEHATTKVVLEFKRDKKGFQDARKFIIKHNDI